MKKIVIGAVSVFAAFGGYSAQPGYDTLIAHRGESVDAPENTLPAYRMAVDRGFGFECDIYRSRDGRLFTFHDPDLKRTTAGAVTNRCTEVDWDSTVSKVNVGGWGRWKGSKFDPTRPALLEEVLALARPGRKIYIEVKGGDAAVGWVDGIRDAVAREPKATPETAIFICFSIRTCRALKEAMPGYRVYWVIGEAPAPTELIATLRGCGADGVDILYKSDRITAEYIAEVKKAGFEFHVWTVDDAGLAAEAFARGVDTVTTNRAKFLYDVLAAGK